jgi:osmotically inducible protein OsmC
MKRNAKAVWEGTGMEGKGSITTQSKVFDEQPYSFTTRFKNEDGKAGTNPEELIGAAHAACFNMALSFQLVGAGFTAERLETKAVVSMDTSGDDFTITDIDLHLDAKVPGISEEKFLELAKGAKENCPVSKALSSIDIKLHAKLNR